MLCVLLNVFCIREWCKSKQWLRKKFVPYISKLRDHSTPFQKIIAKVFQDSAVGTGLVLLWSVQANALPVSIKWHMCKNF